MPAQSLRDDLAHRVAEGHVADDAVAEEGRVSIERPVDELVGNDEVRRLMLFLERAHRRYRQNVFDAEHLHAVDIGAEVEFAGKQAVPASVARQERDRPAIQLSYHV